MIASIKVHSSVVPADWQDCHAPAKPVSDEMSDDNFETVSVRESHAESAKKQETDNKKTSVSP